MGTELLFLLETGKRQAAQTKSRRAGSVTVRLAPMRGSEPTTTPPLRDSIKRPLGTSGLPPASPVCFAELRPNPNQCSFTRKVRLGCIHAQ